MTTQKYVDVSNYSGAFTPDQLAYLKANYQGVIIGLQNATIARQQQQQILGIGLERAYYVDLPGRDITIAEDDAYIFIDIETGCFQSQHDVVYQIARIQAAGYRVGIYGNTGGNSIPAVMGNADLSQWPLWFASYHSQPPSSNVLPTPFNGWTECLMWQWSSNGVAGIICDLNVLFLPDAVVPEPAPERKVVATLRVYDDGFVEIL